MDNKKWTDSDLQTAYEDGCKFFNLNDLKDFLLKRRELAESTDSNCNLQNVSNSETAVCECRPEWMRDVLINLVKCSRCGTEY